MSIRDKYDLLARRMRYTANEGEARLLADDALAMWTCWNVAEFNTELWLAAVVPTSGMATLNDEGEVRTLGTYRNISGYDLTRGIIRLDVTTLIISAVQRGQTLYKAMAETILHEMVHQWCAENGITDHEEDGTHNKEFRRAAWSHGLVCREGCQGYNSTRVRDGHWRRFYELAEMAETTTYPDHAGIFSTTLAHKMRTTYVADEVARALLYDGLDDED